MDAVFLKALADVRRAFPAAKFRYDSSTEGLVSELTPKGAIFLDNAGPLITDGLKWEASHGETIVLAENPVRAVRLLCERAGLNLGAL